MISRILDRFKPRSKKKAVLASDDLQLTGGIFCANILYFLPGV